jgi:hypothetical protein
MYYTVPALTTCFLLSFTDTLGAAQAKAGEVYEQVKDTVVGKVRYCSTLLPVGRAAEGFWPEWASVEVCMLI